MICYLVCIQCDRPWKVFNGLFNLELNVEIDSIFVYVWWLHLFIYIYIYIYNSSVIDGTLGYLVCIFIYLNLVLRLIYFNLYMSLLTNGICQ